MKLMIPLCFFFVLVFTAGCAYYEVTDPTSGRTYYTNSMMSGRYGWSGAVQFRDAESGNNVTLQNSEIKQISGEEYHLRTDR